GETAVPWLASAVAADGTRQVTLEFPEPLLGADRTLQLRALASLVAGRPWRLPGIRPQGLFWQEGSATLLVPAPLALDWLSMEGCRQSKSGALAAPLAGESFEFQFFSPQAHVEASFSQRHARVSLQRGTSINLAPSETTAQFQGEFTVDGGERYHLDADVDEGWIVDFVATDPPDRLRSWSLEAAGPVQRLLSVQLTQPLAPDRPLKLSIGGRLAASARRRFQADDFRMLFFRGAAVEQDLLALSAAGFRLQRSRADDLERLDPVRMSPSQRRLVTAKGAEAVFDLAAGAGGWSVTLEAQRPRYTVAVRVEAALSAGSLVESYVLDCLPEGTPLGRLVVHFTHERKALPRWTLAGEERSKLSARRWTADEETAAGMSQGETWEIELDTPRTTEFELLATRETPLSAELTLSLAAMPQADAQQGTVLVQTEGGAGPVVFNRRLQPVAHESVDPQRHPTVLGSYRYDPSGELGAADPAAITVSPGRGDRAEAVVWQSRLDSRFEPGGRALHLATYFVESAGAVQCRLSLPSEARLLRLTVDGVNLSLGERHNPIAVDLPSGRRFVTLAVEYAVEGKPWGLVGQCDAVWPKSDVVELIRRWRFSLPPEYVWLGGEATADRSWPQRLFGPLGRAPGEQPFDAT
ncbi:MAG TPA: hypothetical protein VGX78_12620, partial [Pirellulales bacterium]|nr:hypothetical protein [Pirellulales bacterium]